MNDLVDRILSIYQLMRPLDPDRVFPIQGRELPDISKSLASAGQSDCPAVGGVRFGLFEKSCTRSETLGLPAARMRVAGGS